MFVFFFLSSKQLNPKLYYSPPASDTGNMQRCLRTPELLLNIFQHVRADEDPGEYVLNQCQGTLAALARTCKDFKEPALDTLWYSLDSFLPLLRCLPGHALEINVVRTPRSRIPTPYPKINVKCNLRREDFDRMLYYTPRIRVLHLDQSVYGAGPPDPFIDEIISKTWKK